MIISHEVIDTWWNAYWNSLYFNGEENFWQIFYTWVGPQVWYREEEVFFIVYVIG